jgi:hypothetical protein
MMVRIRTDWSGLRESSRLKRAQITLSRCFPVKVVGNMLVEGYDGLRGGIFVLTF